MTQRWAELYSTQKRRICYKLAAAKKRENHRHSLVARREIRQLRASNSLTTVNVEFWERKGKGLLSQECNYVTSSLHGDG